MFFEQERLNATLLEVVYIEQGVTKTVNRNRSFCALSFRYSSDAVLQTETDTHRLGDFSLVFVPSGVEYIRKATHEKMIVAHFYLENYYSQNIQSFTPKQSERLGELFRRLYACWIEKQTGYAYRCTAILYEIFELAHIERALPSAPPVEKIAPSIAYLLSDYANPNITIAEIAEKSFVSEVYFRKLFRQNYGVSPKKYLVHLRLEHAKRLMEEGYYSLQEIALLSGFNDYKYFSAEFKKHHEVSPSAYDFSKFDS